MSLESVSGHLDTISKYPRSKDLTFEQLLEESFNTCYGKPQVSEAAFLDMCRKADPNFAPIADKEERRARAALTEKARDAFREIIRRNFYTISPALRNEYQQQHSVQIPRHYLCFLQEYKTEEEQRAVLQVLDGNDQKAKANLLDKHLLSRKDEILGMLDLEGEALVESYKRNYTALTLLTELEMCKGYEYTTEQQQSYNELRDYMSLMLAVVNRMNLMASGYYANYPCERMDLSEDAVNTLFAIGGTVSRLGGESTGGETFKNGEARPIGPTYDFVTSFTALASVNAGLLEKRLEAFAKANGADAKSCIWASESGKVDEYNNAMRGLYEHELLFVNIPGVGLKVLHNAGQGFMNCVPKEASEQEIYERMCRVSENGVKRVDEANPFFLATFTGSSQFNRMAAQHKAVKKMMTDLTPPFNDDKVYQDAKKALKDLRALTDEYLAYKKGQGLEPDKQTGLLIGRSANEKRRLAAAEDAIKLADALNLILQSQKEPQEAVKFVEQREAERQAQIKAKRDQERAMAAEARKNMPKAKVPFAQEELSKTSAEELEPIVEKYQKIPTCAPSDAGDGLYKLQRDIPNNIVRQVIKYAGLKTQYPEHIMNSCKVNVARIVLFDYMLWERQAYSGNTNGDGKIVAGPVERAYNEHRISAEKLVKTAEFDKIFGKFTPARFEKFLVDDESRKHKFDKAVLSLLAPVKENDGNQPAKQPQQLTAEKNQPQVQHEPLKAAAPSVGRGGMG